MRCVNWDICRHRQNSAQKKKCWVKWRMCGDCAAIYHQEEYPESYIKKKITMIKNIGKRNEELCRVLQ